MIAWDVQKGVPFGFWLRFVDDHRDCREEHGCRCWPQLICITGQLLEASAFADLVAGREDHYR